MRLRSLHRLVNQVPSLKASAAAAAAAARVQPCTSSFLTQCRAVGTSGSQKSKDDGGQYIEPDPSKPKKVWVSYGFDFTSQYADRHFVHAFFFVTISLVLVTGGYIMAYFPDHRYRDWAHREAYLELRRREAAGLPPIDINLIDPAKVKLPTDEELGDTDIII